MEGQVQGHAERCMYKCTIELCSFLQWYPLAVGDLKLSEHQKCPQALGQLAIICSNLKHISLASGHRQLCPAGEKEGFTVVARRLDNRRCEVGMLMQAADVSAGSGADDRRACISVAV